MTEPVDPFFDPDSPSTVGDVNQILPKSEGGVIEAVKRAVVVSFREAMHATGIQVRGNAVYISEEYPLQETQYPGIWVQFSTTRLGRAGIAHEWPIKENGVWSLVQEWQFEGRVTLAIVALTSKDRDRLADAVIAHLAFARTPDLVITKPHEDTKQYKALITTLDQNPYIAMTLNTDVIYPGGQRATPGTPWGQEDVLAYEDSYSFDILGQFNVKFRHDGVYELARIDVVPTAVDHIDEFHANIPWALSGDPQPNPQHGIL